MYKRILAYCSGIYWQVFKNMCVKQRNNYSQYQIKYFSSAINTMNIIEHFDKIPLQLLFSIAQPYTLLNSRLGIFLEHILKSSTLLLQ